MNARKKAVPKPGPAWAAEVGEAVWTLPDIQSLAEALEAVETSLQGVSMVKFVDMLLNIDDKIVVAHHDGSKWWVKFG